MGDQVTEELHQVSYQDFPMHSFFGDLAWDFQNRKARGKLDKK